MELNTWINGCKVRGFDAEPPHTRDFSRELGG